MFKNTLFYVGIILFTIVVVIFTYKKILPEKHVHFHAGFVIYKDGKMLDFSDYKYMSPIPCTDDQHTQATKDRVHLHDGVGNVVHVHANGVRWEELFKYLKFKMPTNEAYVNGKRVDNIQAVEIHPYDSLVVLIGKQGNVNDYLKKAPSKEYIEKMEKQGICKE
jgi:hypothetical protein